MAKWLAALMALTVIGSSVSVQAADEKEKPDPETVFKRKDKDSDGFLTWDEFKGKLEGDKLENAKKQFEAKDADKDMKLSLEEFKAKVKKAK